jgi:hypothetical protein
MSSDNESLPLPDDFPRGADVASVPGVQPKLSVVRDATSGTYVANHDSAETAARFEVCEDLAEQLAEKCRRNRNGKYARFSEHEILRQLLERLLDSGWGTDAEMRWTARRTAEKLGWHWY